MALLRSTVTMAVGLAGALSLSQAPEFAQQYRQRLGGALEELARIVIDFDADAAKSGLGREDALQLYLTSTEQFFRDRGERMRATIARMETLSRQAKWFETLPPTLRPVALARGHDETLMAGLWRDFEPAMPLTVHGAVWGGGGFVLGTMLLWLVTLPWRLWRGRRRRRRSLLPVHGEKVARRAG